MSALRARKEYAAPASATSGIASYQIEGTHPAPTARLRARRRRKSRLRMQATRSN